MQQLYKEEANLLFPKGCQCGDISGDNDVKFLAEFECDWCTIYYYGVLGLLKEYSGLREQLATAQLKINDITNLLIERPK